MLGLESMSWFFFYNLSSLFYLTENSQLFFEKLILLNLKLKKFRKKNNRFVLLGGSTPDIFVHLQPGNRNLIQSVVVAHSQTKTRAVHTCAVL